MCRQKSRRCKHTYASTILILNDYILLPACFQFILIYFANDVERVLVYRSECYFNWKYIFNPNSNRVIMSLLYLLI